VRVVLDDTMLLGDTPEWQALQRELVGVSRAAHAFNAYVVDAWDNLRCAAHDFSEKPRDDLVDLILEALGKDGTPLTRGGKLDACLDGRAGHAYLKTFGSCYVLLLRYPGPFDQKVARAAVSAALPAIEALTLRLPPSGGPDSHGTEAAKRA